MKMLRAALLALGLLLVAPAQATEDDLRSITGMRDHFRVLIVFTPSLADARLASQRAIMAKLAIEASKRDLLFVQVDPMHVIGASDKADKLRRMFVVPVLNYHAILVDKDGRTLQETHGPMEAAAILHAIDTAPRRQYELHRARMGKPVVDKS
jgi:sirohydrochlorin ferrochelatase